jgi:hypothetical protein
MSEEKIEAADQSPREKRKLILQQVLSDLSTDNISVRSSLLEWAMEKSPPSIDLGPVNLDLLATSPSFTYWHSSIRNAPPIVKSCVASQKKYLGAGHRVLDDSCLDRVINMPQIILSKRDSMTITHYSDIVRLCLLAQYGGVWLDATVYMSGPLEGCLKSSSFFAYSRPHDPLILSSWLLVAERANYLIIKWLDLLVQYWRDFSNLNDYFLLHHLFEILILTDPRFRKQWRSMHHRSFLPPHYLQSQLLSAFDASMITEAYRQTSIHKLTYKYKRNPLVSESVADYLCAHSKLE